MNELIQLTAAEAAAKLAAGEITSVELTQAHLDRIAATDGAPLSDNRADGKSGLNAFLHVNAEEALATAAAVDADRAGAVPCPPRGGQGTAPRWPACPSPLRTSSSPRVSPPPRHPACSKAG